VRVCSLMKGAEARSAHNITLPTRACRCLMAWQQCWQQSRLALRAAPRRPGARGHRVTRDDPLSVCLVGALGALRFYLEACLLRWALSTWTRVCHLQTRPVSVIDLTADSW